MSTQHNSIIWIASFRVNTNRNAERKQISIFHATQWRTLFDSYLPPHADRISNVQSNKTVFINRDRLDINTFFHDLENNINGNFLRCSSNKRDLMRTIKSAISMESRFYFRLIIIRTVVFFQSVKYFGVCFVWGHILRVQLKLYNLLLPLLIIYSMFIFNFLQFFSYGLISLLFVADRLKKLTGKKRKFV